MEALIRSIMELRWMFRPDWMGSESYFVFFIFYDSRCKYNSSNFDGASVCVAFTDCEFPKQND